MSIEKWLNPPIKEGQSGNIRIEQFTINPADTEYSLFNLKSGSRGVRPGTYVRMYEKGNLWMSNTHAEYRDVSFFLNKAKGDVIVNGLGLGLVVHCLLSNIWVKSVTVIEKNPDVIALVAPYFAETYGGRFTCIQADALEYKIPKGSEYDYAWHDIWLDITADNYPDMKKLNRKWGRFVKQKQFSWCYERVKEEYKRNESFMSRYR